MNVVVCTRPGEFEYQKRDVPQLQPGHTLLRIKRIGICGTDLHAYEGTQPFFDYPRILGHELAATVVATDHPGFTKDEAVTFIPYFSCGSCIACRRGRPNCCTSVRVCGVHIDGGMAEFLLVPSSQLIKSQDLGFDELALAEPLAIGAHGVRRAKIERGEFVLVIGAGPIGLGAMEFATIDGAKVIAMDINNQRLAFCRERLNMEHTVNPTWEDAIEKLMEITGGDMPTAVIDATGSRRAIEGAFSFIAHGGRFVLIGLQKDEISFSHPGFHKREATLMSSRNATKTDFERAISCMREGSILPATYITHRLGFNEVGSHFVSLLDPASGAIKAMIEL